MPRRATKSAKLVRPVLLLFLAIAGAAAPSAAQAIDEIPPESACHANGNPAVRARSPLALAAMEFGLRHSTTFEALWEGLQETDMIVYVDSDLKPLGDIWGHTSFISKTPQCRYVRVAITAHLNLSQAAALLGHELQHVLEIAAHPEVIDEASMSAMYERYGRHSRYENSYDSQEAVDVGTRVAAELMGGSVSVKSSPADSER